MPDDAPAPSVEHEWGEMSVICGTPTCTHCQAGDHRVGATSKCPVRQLAVVRKAIESSADKANPINRKVAERWVAKWKDELGLTVTDEAALITEIAEGLAGPWAGTLDALIDTGVLDDA